MKAGYFFKAVFKPFNLLLLVLALVSAGLAVNASALLTAYSAAGVLSTGIFAVSVARTLKNPAFVRELQVEQKLDNLRRLSRESADLFGRTARKVDRETRSRMQGVLKQKEELIRYFRGCSDDPVKQVIVDQALKLVIAYFNLAYSYYIRGVETTKQNISAIEQRINYNNRRLGSLKSYDAVLELTKTVEMDEKLLKSIREEKQELEKINVRMNYIESTINSFKHRIISSDSSDPEVGEIEEIINEATALDSALNERRKMRL